MGLLSTLVNVLSKPVITFNPTALGRNTCRSLLVEMNAKRILVTTTVTGAFTLILSCVFLYYNNYLLAAVKADHQRAYGDVDAKEAINNSNGGQPMAV